MICAAGRFTGIFAAANSAFPISTRTRRTVPPLGKSQSRFMPLKVSISISLFGTAPLSNRYFPTQRIALPHIFPSLPSALNIRIFASARPLGQMSTIPSPPMPLCLSESRTAKFSGEASGSRRQSK